MALELRDCSFFGPALPEPFVKFQLEAELTKRKLLPKTTGNEGRALQERWEVYRRKLRALGEHGGDRRVASHVLEPLTERLGYQHFEPQTEVITREGPENGGWLFTAADGRTLRAWSVGLGMDLDAPSQRGRAYRFSPSRVAQRVLLASSERVGLLTDGEELRLLFCDPARPDSHIAVRLDRSGGWRAARSIPDSYRLLLALASPAGVAALPELAEAARLAQSTVTKKLRLQARRAIEGFLQELLDHPGNAAVWDEWEEPAALASALWREGLILVYRLLFVFKLESSADPARAFSFATTSLWQNTYSPNTALACLVRRVLDHGADTGGFIESGLRTLWRMFSDGMSSSELEVKPLGGMLFGEGTTPLLDRLTWGERGVARLLDALLWTPGDGKTERERVHYGALDVEDLGRVYEALLELEPGVTTEPMCRLRRAKLEVVVPVAQGAPYRTDLAPAELSEDDVDDGDGEDGDEDSAPSKRGGIGSKTKVQFIEEIPAGRFFLRVGLGRKASGSYYTPHPFVRFLVEETLGPQLAERSPKEDPHPGRILQLKVLDPAMGSGHFLVEACRYLGAALYEACRLCDELAVQAEEQAKKAAETERDELLAHAAELRKRVENLPDPEDELVAYLPSRAVEGEESGLSQRKAESLCRRLVAVHCLYGVDKNPLAVELAKLALWLESYAEGLPLTFMDHRLICGDSLTGPSFEHLLTYPKSGDKLDDLFAQGLTARLQATLAAALAHVRDLEASVGKDVADLEQKRTAKEKLDAALKPLKTLAAAWSGGVMLSDECDDAGYQALAQAVAKGEDVADVLAARPRVGEMVEVGESGVPFELAFPEVFADGADAHGGFDAVLGNPPWKKLNLEEPAFLGSFDVRALAADGVQRKSIREQLEGSEAWRQWRLASELEDSFVQTVLRTIPDTFDFSGGAFGGGDIDIAGAFLARCWTWSSGRGRVGLVVPSAIHASKTLTPLRERLLSRAEICSYYCFENRGKRIFQEIDARWKFTPLVLSHLGSTPRQDEFLAQFYLHRMAWLFDEQQNPEPLRLSRRTIRSMDPQALVFQEFTDPRDADIAKTAYDIGTPFATVATRLSLHIRRELDATDDAWRLDHTEHPRFPSDVAGRGLIHHKPGTLHQYNDQWEGAETALVPFTRLAEGKETVLNLARYFRTAYRVQARATDERTAIFCMLPWATTATNKVRLEGNPASRPNAVALALVGVANSFCFDWLLRLRTGGLTIAKYVLDATPLINFDSAPIGLLAHAALRLTCNHAGYAPLWTEQLGDAWREPTPRHTWPVLDSDDARWAVRAVIDTVVADAYRLDRAQYEHVLSSFSHKSYPRAPELCLAAFDELKALGLDAFTKKHDPYWDIPLNESLPKPAIELPGMEGVPDSAIEEEASVADEYEEAPASSLTKPHLHSTDAAAVLLSYALLEHMRGGREATLGSVKCEKLLHLAESHLEVDLGRAPMRLAAGPADFPHLKKVFHRADRRWAAFRVVARPGGDGAKLVAHLGLASAAARLDEAFGPKADQVRELIQLLLPMDSGQAEIVATLYASWNDLLARGVEPDDASIIEEFYGWAAGKKRFDADRLRRALEWMRKQGLVPTGRAAPTKARGDGNGKKTRSRANGSGAAEDVYATVVRLLDERVLISSKDAQEATGLDAAGVRPHLERLVEEGRAVTEGQRRGMKYRRPDG